MTPTKVDPRNIRKIAPFNLEGHEEGTTTASYANALNLDSRGQRSKTIILTNTHATHGLKYKLLISASFDGGAEAEEVAETTLAALATAKFRYTGAYARMILQVKTASGTDHATYTADFTMSGI